MAGTKKRPRRSVFNEELGITESVGLALYGLVGLALFGLVGLATNELALHCIGYVSTNDIQLSVKKYLLTLGL